MTSPQRPRTNKGIQVIFTSVPNNKGRSKQDCLLSQAKQGAEMASAAPIPLPQGTKGKGINIGFPTDQERNTKSFGDRLVLAPNHL